jgi:DNA-binding protein HU-beta
MNKRDLIDAISGRLGDKKTATEAVNAVLDTIQHTVAKGDKVAITGFGVFEKAVRPARTARNPATGATIKVPKSSVPKFRPGADFKAVVNGEKKTTAAKKRLSVRATGGPPVRRAPGRVYCPGPISSGRAGFRSRLPRRVSAGPATC